MHAYIMYCSMQIYGLQSERGISTSTHTRIKLIGTVLTLHGTDVPLTETILKIMHKDLYLNKQGPYCNENYMNWLDNPLLVYTSTHQPNGYHRSISSICNNQSILPLLQRAYTKAKLLFEAGAYVHQYKTYGIEESDFINAFHNVGQIISDYSNM